MKIGIVTFYRVPNYGAMLQAYSLWKYLEKRGHEVVFIQHKRCVVKRMPLWRCFISRKLQGIRIKLKNYVRFPMTEFAKDYPQTRYCETIEDVKTAARDCDAYIVGSDQMWNPRWFSSNDALPLVMLDFAEEGKPRISYAASFGTREWREDQNAIEAGRLLNKFNAISVREESGVGLVESLSGRKDAQWLLDPTLLQTTDFYRNVARGQLVGFAPCKASYIFSYVINESHNDVKMHKALELVKDSLVIPAVESDVRFETGAVGVLCRMLDVSSKIKVEEWLNKIANADFIFTDSFHGTVFAILFHRPFVSMLIEGGMAGMNERLFSLLKVLGLEERCCTSADICSIQKVLKSSIPWDEVDSRILSERKKVSEFLEGLAL